MTKRMLVDAMHPEETRVAIVESYRDTNRLEDLDFGLASKPILRGNIYLAKVMRIEPSLQAAFVEYGGNRHGFLPFSEIHPDYFRIPVADRPAEEMEGEESEESLEQENDEDSTEDYAQEREAVEREEAAAISSENGPEPATETSADALLTTDEAAPQEQAAPNEEPSAAPAIQTPAPFAEAILDPDTDVGLITDFGNAAVGDVGQLTEVAMPETPPESVGGEVTERIVRHHRPRYKIQEVLKRGQVMLIQVVKEERGNKGAALTTFLSLAGRYCVLMPNTDHGGGVSRKITNHQDRRRMKEILDQLEIPDGMAVILRTAGMEQTPPEIQRDLEYLLRLWDNIREQTLQSSAPAMIYEEANLIKRSLRDLFTQDIAEILVAGEDAFNRAKEFMHAIMPDQADKIKLYDDAVPLFIRYQVENQIDSLHTPIAQLRSGGYLVINPTEALVSVDVNSGRATRERHIEETALKTNLEAADEVGRQLRLRDLAGLVVIDFIDMEDGRNNAAVERRMKESMKNDRARVQIGRISPFGLMELSRQRLRPSLTEINFEKCPHCAGIGLVRSPDSAALSVLRAIEEEAIRGRVSEIKVSMPAYIVLYILNHKRADLNALEARYSISLTLEQDDLIPPPGFKLEKVKARVGGKPIGPVVSMDEILAEAEQETPEADSSETETASFAPRGTEEAEGNEEASSSSSRRGGRRNRFRRNDRRDRRPRDAAAPTAEGAEAAPQEQASEEGIVDSGEERAPQQALSPNDQDNQRRRRRGRRGGRRRGNNHDQPQQQQRSGSPRNGEPSEGNQGNWAPPAGGENAAAQPPRREAFIPASIHEIDTTPKPFREEPQKKSSSAQRSYEVVNPPTEAPKAGWWRRLTGQ